jgi:NAD(P)-dependent dehydrogenase (short-subunit alcohol dehydrogenase family)
MNVHAKSLMLTAGIAYGAFWLSRAALRSTRWFDFRDKSVIVTGGSRGLGLCMARQLANAGANVTICARTSSDIQNAVNDLALYSPRGSRGVLGICCDVRDHRQTDQLARQAISQFGGIDVLINNAGIIEVGPLDAMTSKDFQRSMDTHCWGALNTILSVLPTMRKAGWGRILNIASLGGKRAVPHMLPYAASKFALVGLSGGLRTELARENILVTTVCPGLMRTGSPRNATFKGQHRKEYAWFSIGDSMPLMSINADHAASKILRACQNGDAETTVAGLFNLSGMIATIAPNLASEVLSVMNLLLPTMGGIGQRAARGFESESSWSPSILTRLTDLAAIRNLEVRDGQHSPLTSSKADQVMHVPDSFIS